MNRLAQFNPSHFDPASLLNGGTQKVQHPAAGYSNTVSKNVEDMYKDFNAFHKNLKNLVMLYKTRHQLMESMNENGLYTAKCYKEMLEGTPLSGIVCPEAKHKAVIDEKAKDVTALAVVESDNTPNAPRQLDAYIERRGPSIESDDIDTSEYPESGVIREKLDPDEGSRIGKELSRDPDGLKEGLKASKMISVRASNETQLATIKDAVGEKGRKHIDPPSAASIASGSSVPTSPLERRASTDPPSNKYPDDEMALSIEKNPSHVNDNFGGSLNIIVDDDEDSFTHGRCTQEKALMVEDKTLEDESKEVAADGEKHSLAEEIVEDANNVVEHVKDLVFGKSKSEKDEDTEDKLDDRTEDKLDDRECKSPSPVHSADDGNEDDRSNGSASDLEPAEKDDNEYLNISKDGDLLVLKNAPESESLPTPLSNSAFRSYYDVHKAAYKEANAKLDEHTKLLKYAEEWEHTVSTRVQSRYGEYAKCRKALNHYAKKVGALLDEEERMKEKNKPMKPKQMEKLERNQLKLRGTRETHDRAGEELIMLVEEIIRRGWKDAFPLLQKSIGFEMDFAAIEHKHMSHLSASSELLEAIGAKESIPADGRLEKLKNSSPEEIFMGRATNLPGKIDV